nr:hypothetical protein [Aeromonas caviae]
MEQSGGRCGDPNPCLGDEQQAIIASDYAMTDGKLLIEQRVPLMHYALERMQVSYNGEHANNPCSTHWCSPTGRS